MAWAGLVISPVSQDVSGVVANGLFMTSRSLLSPVYMNQHIESCFMLLRQPIVCALPLALDNAGSNSAARMAMIAMTTSNSIKVKASTTPFDMAYGFTGTNLTLQWPSDHIGWRLLYQTNHLAQGISTNMANWDVYPGAAFVDQTTIPVDLAKPAEFYRMVYP